MPWDPWKALSQLDDVRLEWADLRGGRGRVDVYPDGHVITLDYRLVKRERRAVLAHELVHVERGIFFDEDSPRALVQAEERAVRREVAWRLCPPVELGRRIRRAVDDGQAVTAAVVAEWFDVPERIGREALELHAIAQARTRHPTGRTAERAADAA